MRWVSERSESDTRTLYEIGEPVFEGVTGAGVEVLIADSPAYGRMLFLDGELQSATADEHLYHEALVHPTMAGAMAEVSSTKPDPLRVLVVGAGEGATVREVLKYQHVAHVDWVDYDVELVELCREHLAWAPLVYTHPRVKFWGGDIHAVWPRLGRYDVIILDLPDPDGETGYLYSDAFWADLHLHLFPGGRIVTHCGPVRPFGDVGAGYQRLTALMSGGSFYHQVIPSFQGSWGFLMWGGAFGSNPFAYAQCGQKILVPRGLRVANADQIERWASHEFVWSQALSLAKKNV